MGLHDVSGAAGIKTEWSGFRSPQEGSLRAIVTNSEHYCEVH